MLADGTAPVQRQVAEAEAATARHRAYMTTIVPGLLQTPAYARAVLAGVIGAYDAPDDLDEGVRARMDRQKILTKPGYSFHFVLLEQVLWSPVGSLGLWGAQLARLAAAARGEISPAVRLGVIKQGTVWGGSFPNMSHGFNLSDDSEASVELAHTYEIAGDPDDIALFAAAFAYADAHAVYGEDAARAIEAVAAELGVVGGG